MIKFLCAAAIGLATIGSAAADAVPMSPTQALGMVGSSVIVEGPVSLRPASGGRDGVELALRSGDNSAVIIAYISKGDVERFPDLNVLDHRIVDVSGVVEMASGQAEIHVTSPSQLAIAR